MRMNCCPRLSNLNQRFSFSANSLDKVGRVFRNSPDMKTSIPSVLIKFALVCFGLFPRAQAVVPAPDGGYPGHNTAEGQNALFSLTTGTSNTANGYEALFKNTTGNWNIAIGSDALHENTTRHGNTAIGFQALFNNTGASWNTANGFSGAL